MRHEGSLRFKTEDVSWKMEGEEGKCGFRIADCGLNSNEQEHAGGAERGLRILDFGLAGLGE